jgi:hypothetical protein
MLPKRTDGDPNDKREDDYRVLKSDATSRAE